jgi:hypothetical protein
LEPSSAMEHTDLKSPPKTESGTSLSPAATLIKYPQGEQVESYGTHRDVIDQSLAAAMMEALDAASFRTPVLFRFLCIHFNSIDR